MMFSIAGQSLEFFMGADKPAKPEQSALSALKSSGLGALITHAGELADVDQTLRRSLPPALARQCRLVSWDDSRLVFHAASPVWKNKLRLHSQEVLAAAQSLGLHAREIRIKVDVGFTPNADLMA
ncbi:MAG: DciA family protein [Arenimonas sp.]|jgi:hypothetical protein